MAGMAFAIRVASAGVTFLSQIALARWMGGFDFGIYVAVWTWLVLAGDIVHLGLPLIAQRYIPEYTHHNQFDALRGFLIGSRWITFGLATAFALIGAGAIFALTPWLDPHTVLPFYLACVSLPFFTHLADVRRARALLQLDRAGARAAHSAAPGRAVRADGAGLCGGIPDRRHHHHDRADASRSGARRCCSSCWWTGG